VIAGEQAALRRVATLVARAAAPEEVFAAVTGEAGRLLGAHLAMMDRYEPDGAVTVVASWSSTGTAFPTATRWSLGGRNLHTMVFQTHRPARINDVRYWGQGTWTNYGAELARRASEAASPAT
jgi:GAF domain-containing protein